MSEGSRLETALLDDRRRLGRRIAASGRCDGSLRLCDWRSRCGVPPHARLWANPRRRAGSKSMRCQLKNCPSFGGC